MVNSGLKGLISQMTAQNEVIVMNYIVINEMYSKYTSFGVSIRHGAKRVRERHRLPLIIMITNKSTGTSQ